MENNTEQNSENVVEDVQKLVDDDFTVPMVEVDEETLWKVKKALDEYSKLMTSISETISESNPKESGIAKGRSEEIAELKCKLDSLKIKE